jgi:hypothetical protein
MQPVAHDSDVADVPAPLPKPWYTSAGVWGAVVTLAGSILALLRIQLDPALLDDVRDWLIALSTLVGGAVALWGRVRATRPIRRNDTSDLSKPTRFLLLALIAGAIIGSASGCADLVGPAGSYVSADRATYDAIAPEYQQYVSADPSLDPEQRQRRTRTVELWRRRLESAESHEPTN